MLCDPLIPGHLVSAPAPKTRKMRLVRTVRIGGLWQVGYPYRSPPPGRGQGIALAGRVGVTLGELVRSRAGLRSVRAEGV